jgi:hypothetical protein
MRIEEAQSDQVAGEGKIYNGMVPIPSLPMESDGTRLHSVQARLDVACLE